MQDKKKGEDDGQKFGFQKTQKFVAWKRPGAEEAGRGRGRVRKRQGAEEAGGGSVGASLCGRRSGPAEKTPTKSYASMQSD